MDIIKKLDKTLKKTLKTKHTRLISSIILLCVIVASLRGSPKLFLILNNPIFKICISLAIIYISTRDMPSAIILVIVYIFILHSVNKINVDTFIGGTGLSDDIMQKVIGKNNEISGFINTTSSAMNLGIPAISLIKMDPAVSTSTTVMPTPSLSANDPRCVKDKQYCWPEGISQCVSPLGINSVKPCMEKGKLYVKGRESVSCSDDKKFFNTDDTSGATTCYGGHTIYNKKFQMLDVPTNTFVFAPPSQ